MERLAYQIEYPPCLYMVLKRDCDTVKFEPHALMQIEERHCPAYQLEVFTNATTGHMSSMRSPFYHDTGDYATAKQRADWGNTKGKKVAKRYRNSDGSLAHVCNGHDQQQ